MKYLITYLEPHQSDLLQFSLRHCEFTQNDLTPPLIFDLLEATEKTLETVLHHLTMSRVQLLQAFMTKEEEGGTGKSLLHELIHMMRYQTVKRVHEWTKKTEVWGEIVSKSIKWGEGES
jgi:hypothetical protein